jgi:predicted nucleic acid-binding protein
VIFIDTSAWYALSSMRDVNYQDAIRTLSSLRERLVTSDYVVDETLTLLQSRGERLHALKFGAKVIDGAFAEIITVHKHDFDRAWEVFQRCNDKGWSFTDCTSLVVMQRLGIQRAFAFDDHFRQFGAVTVVP